MEAPEVRRVQAAEDREVMAALRLAHLAAAVVEAERLSHFPLLQAAALPLISAAVVEAEEERGFLQ